LLCLDYCCPQGNLFLLVVFSVSAEDSSFLPPNLSIAGVSTPGALSVSSAIGQVFAASVLAQL
jgi:hypothetical protein